MKTNYTIESLAKKLVVSYEESFGRRNVAKEEGEYGYDLKSQDINGEIRYIEIKSTEKSHLAPRWLEQKEYEAMQKLENYYVYAVTKVELSSNTGVVTEIHKKEWQKYFIKEEIHRWYKLDKSQFINRGSMVYIQQYNDLA